MKKSVKPFSVALPLSRMGKSQIMDEIEKLSSKQSLNANDYKMLSKYIEQLKKIEEDKTLSEMIDLFPALQKYKEEHSIINLQKLCVEISEFCRAVYASTQSEDERKVYRNMIEKLNK